MQDIEILNILIINCNTIVQGKQIELPIAIQTQPSPRVQDVSRSVPMEGRKLANKEGAIQTQAVIQI